jgi:ABC-type branched-subunit amino acid transport system ATPase component
MTPESGAPILEVRGVTKLFGGLRALDGVDLEVPRGQVVGLIGPNGSGKTTLFNIVTGAYKPTSGSVWFEGREITGLSSFRTCRLGIARTFQQICLFERLTVMENVVAGLVDRSCGSVRDWLLRSGRHYGEAGELLDYVGLAGKEWLVAGALPYGDQRSLEVARALATEPKLLLLDEPLAGMNPAEIEGFLHLVDRIRDSGVSILLIEHNVRAVMECCPTTFVFDYGRRIACGTAEELMCDDAVIKAYLGEEIAEVTTGELLGVASDGVDADDA